MPHQPLARYVRFLQKPRASAQRLILRKDYVELKFQFLTLAPRDRRELRSTEFARQVVYSGFYLSMAGPTMAQRLALAELLRVPVDQLAVLVELGH